LFFSTFQIFGSFFAIAQTNKLCLNRKILFFCGSPSIIYKQHIKKSQWGNGSFWKKKIRKIIKKFVAIGNKILEIFCNLAKKYGRLQSRALIIFLKVYQ
jgi:hypothetical protein